MNAIDPRVYRWITRHQGELWVMGPLTLIAPSRLVSSIYAGNHGRDLWGGRGACVTLSFDCDYPEDVQAVPGLIRMLRKHGIRASFACVGSWIDAWPREHAGIVESGHEIVNHTWSHPDNELLNPGRRFRDLARSEKKAEIERCHETMRTVLGCEPRGFRVPHFKRLFSADLYGILAELGYAYSSSTWLTNTLSHGLPFRAGDGIVEFPLSVCPAHPFTVFDTWHSLRAKRLSHRVIHRGARRYVELFFELIQLALDTGSYLNVYMDPLDVEKLPDFERVLERLSDGDILVATYEEYLGRGLVIA